MALPSVVVTNVGRLDAQLPSEREGRLYLRTQFVNPLVRQAVVKAIEDIVQVDKVQTDKKRFEVVIIFSELPSGTSRLTYLENVQNYIVLPRAETCMKELQKHLPSTKERAAHPAGSSKPSYVNDRIRLL